jgi:hypothetical protein
MYREKNQGRHKLGEKQCDGLDLKKALGKTLSWSAGCWLPGARQPNYYNLVRYPDSK